MTSSRENLGTLSIATAANFAQFGARVVVSPFVLAIAATFSVSKGDVGLVLTLLWATYALLQFPSGVFADRYGERRVVLAALGLTAVGSLLVALAPSYPVFALAVMVLGVGTGLYFAVGTSLLSRLFDATGWPFSVHSAGSPLAGLALPVIATALAAQYGWRAGVAVGAVVAAVAFALVLVTVDPLSPTSPDMRLGDRFRPDAILDILTRPEVAFTAAVGALGMYVFQSFVSFFPTFLQEYHGLSESRAGLLFGVAFLLVAVFLPVAGWLADRSDPDVGLLVPFLVTVAGFLTVLAVDGPALIAGVVVLGAGVTWGGALQSRLMAKFDPGEKGTGFGVTRTAFVLVGSTGNVATGTIAETAGWPAAFGVVVALLLVASALVVGNRVLGLGL